MEVSALTHSPGLQFLSEDKQQHGKKNVTKRSTPRTSTQRVIDHRDVRRAIVLSTRRLSRTENRVINKRLRVYTDHSSEHYAHTSGVTPLQPTQPRAVVVWGSPQVHDVAAGPSRSNQIFSSTTNAKLWPSKQAMFLLFDAGHDMYNVRQHVYRVP